MPRQARFQSKWAQQSAIAVTMGLVLAAVLGLAWGTTRTQPVQLAGARLSVPTVWDAVESFEEQAAAEGKVFRFGEGQASRLAVASYTFPEPVDPGTAAQVIQHRLPIPTVDILRAAARSESLQLGRIQGKRYLAVQRVGREPIVQLDWLTLMTADGRTYWVVHLTEITHALARGQTKRINRNLIRDIEQSITLTGTQAKGER